MSYLHLHFIFICALKKTVSIFATFSIQMIQSIFMAKRRLLTAAAARTAPSSFYLQINYFLGQPRIAHSAQRIIPTEKTQQYYYNISGTEPGA